MACSSHLLRGAPDPREDLESRSLNGGVPLRASGFESRSLKEVPLKYPVVV